MMIDKSVKLLKYRLRFILFLLLAFILTVISGIYFIRYIVKPNTGLVVNFPEVIVKDGRTLFSPKTPFSPAVAAGLRPNEDIILSINGNPVNGSWDIVKNDSKKWDFNLVHVKILRNGTEKSVFIQPILNLTRVDWLFELIFIIVLSFTAFYLTFTLPDDTASNFIVLASLFYLVFTALKPFYYESFFPNLLIHLGKITAWMLVFFTLYFPYKKGSRLFRKVFIGTIIAIYVIFTVTRMYYYWNWSHSSEELWLNKYRFLGRLGNVSDGIAYIVYFVLLIVSYFKTSYNSEKRQIEWILAGVLIALPVYFFLDELPYIMGNLPGMRVSMGNFANLFLTFVPLFFILGLMKHRVFNINFFAARYIVYSILGLITFAFFTVLYEPLTLVFMNNYGLTEKIAGFITVTLLFITLFVLRVGLVSLVEKVFYKSHFRKTFQYSAQLENKNMELMLIIDELNKEKMKSFQTKKLRELRGIVTGIAHKINNPVNYIANALVGLEKSIDSIINDTHEDGGANNNKLYIKKAEIRKYLNIAQEGSLQIRNFVRKLVSLTGSKVSIPVNIEAAAIIKDAVKEAKEKYENIKLKYRIKDPVKIRCYPGELVHAVIYGIDNAVESSDSRSNEILVESSVEESKDVIIKIEDHGKGIDSLNLKKIFDPFFTTKYNHEGLGLYFCRTIVERNGGVVEVKSELNMGTRLYLKFPVIQPA
ncbi:MAG: hypothetical protein J7K04_04110 [Spirochaetales bacterium]|nr:hypothetical protein [Spirochaetales bacterium]